MSWSETKLLMDKLNEGVSINETAQTKKFTNTVAGAMGTSNTTITGTGRISIYGKFTTARTVTLTLDGVSIPDFSAGQIRGVVATFYFEKSVVFKAAYDNEICYIVQT